MAGLFNIDLSSIGSAIQGVGKGVTDFVAGIQGKLTPEQQQQANALAISAQQAVDTAQAAIDEKEAGNSNLFVAGWRPAIGWVCGFAIAYNFIIMPFGNLVLKILKVDFPMPAVDYGELWTLVTGMLGLGGMRTWEKIKGAAGSH